MPRSVDELPDAPLRQFSRPPVPPLDDLDDVYLIGICGTGMGALAGLFRQAGKDVRGADDGVYPPMSTHLAEQGIPVQEGYDPAHLDPAPDLTVVGNACTPTHPEAAYAREERLPQQSFPEALAHCFLTDARRPLVVTGTHGKTTTTSLLVHLLQHAGRDPGFLVGGVMNNTGKSYALGADAPFVVEGDEYDSAYFDKRPKFMHYRPHAAVVSSVEFDHADIFADRDDYRGAFKDFVGLLDREGLLALCGDDPAVRALADHASATVRTYGLDPGNDVRAEDRSTTAEGQTFTLRLDGGGEEVHFPHPGHHNAENALAAALLAHREGVSLPEIAAGLATFEGMKRRQEVRGRPNDVLVVDDFAHHPTAVEATMQALRAAHPDRRLVALFEPRSNTSRRNLFQAEYGKAFDAADRVFLKAPPIRHNDDPDAMLDPDAVVQTIRDRGTPAETFENVDAVLPTLVDTLQPGDVALLMSNGSFGGLPERLPDALAEAA
ncbi:MAG: UDP-N-acetylmuramate:L-alanyl-gamma-D-glutamyl-meso-diaminopimelate ligase [Bacteroidetes bacterium QH_2_64_26]|nr:MAG: UDP-N-acetylmuramate:L-alanyl-gamma-D-glutamyl-meso-diaminopimelate ligase [Bacteroidetes bacterium QH_2_64_26]